MNCYLYKNTDIIINQFRNGEVGMENLSIHGMNSIVSYRSSFRAGPAES